MLSNRKIILIIVLLVTLCLSAYVIIVIIPSRIAERTYAGAKKIGHDLQEIFHFTPEVKVNNTVVVQQQASVLELATLAQRFQHRYVWTHTWVKSTKKITITGTYQAKVGFDLRKKFVIDIKDEKAIVKLPMPQLLSLEPLGDIVFEDEHGIWNWVNAEDRSKAINAFHNNARTYAEKSEFIEDAKVKLEDQLKKILQPYVSEIQIVYDETLNKQR
jgi:hypothetical protein